MGNVLCSVGLPLLGLSVVLGLSACESKSGEGPAKESSAAAKSTSGPAAGGGPINVVSATFGKACGAPAGNHTQLVATECNGKDKCAFFVTNPGKDPFPNCAKDFAVEYRCGTQAEARHVEHAAVGGENYTVDLVCR